MTNLFIRMRIPEDVSNAQIQQILSDIVSKNQFFPRPDSSPSSARDQAVPSSIRDKSKTETMSDCKLLVYRSSVRLDNSFKREIMDTLKMDEFYSEIINELESRERKEIVRKNETYRNKNELLVVHCRIK